MATIVVQNNKTVVAAWAAANQDSISMGALVGNSLTVQIAVNTEILQGSNDGTNWDTVATAAAANDVITVTGVPLFIRAAAAGGGAPTGAFVVVGYRAD